MIFQCSTVALAISVTHLLPATSRLQDLVTVNESSPDQLALLLNEIPLAVALRVNAEHQSSTPRNPHDTTMLLAELLLGRAMNNVQHPTHRQDMILALQVLSQRCQELNLTQGRQALQRHLHFYMTDALRDQITDQDKMDPSLFLAVARTTETQVELWEEELTYSPFPSGWMQATQLSDSDTQAHSLATFPACNLLSACLQPDSILVGHVDRHHFRIVAEQQALGNDLKGLLLNLCRYLRTRGTIAPLPSLQQSIPARLHEMQDRVSIFLPAHLFAQVRTATHLTPRRDLPHAIKTMWQESPMLSCTQTYCQGLEVSQIREGLTATWTQLSYAQALTIPAYTSEANTPLQLSHMQQSDGVLMSNSLWTSDELLWMTTLRHLGVTQERTLALNAPSAKLITQLIERLALVTADRIGIIRKPRLPHHFPQSCHGVNPPTPTRVTFHSDQRMENDTPISITHPCPRPLVHPAMVRYVPPLDVLRPTSTRPKRARTVAQHAPLPTEFQLLGDRELYTLRAYGTKPDDILIGAATAPGSYYAAYARTRITANANGVYPRLGEYTDKHRGKTPAISHSSDLVTSDGSYAIEMTANGKITQVDPFLPDTCTARAIDEAETEEMENCCFVLEKGKIWIQATRDIEPGEQLYIRYGYRYWMHDKWPLHLLRTMYSKYAPTLPQPTRQRWQAIIQSKRDEVNHSRQLRPPPILKAARRPSRQADPVILQIMPSMPSLIAPRSGPDQAPKQRRRLLQRTLAPPAQNPARKRLTSMQKTKRAHAKRDHRNRVKLGLTPPLRPVPGPPAAIPFRPDFLDEDWSQIIDQGHPDLAQLCIMSWSCSGHLYSSANAIVSEVPQFLSDAMDMIEAYGIDILWLNDGRFTKGTLDRHLHVIQQRSPDARVLQFPTTAVTSGSRCQQFNQMGGAIAIINYKWKTYVKPVSTDPMGMGIINAIDIEINQVKIRSLNIYFLNENPQDGEATMKTRTSKHQHAANYPSWIRRLSALEFQFRLAQLMISAARTKPGWFVIVQGDFNRQVTDDSAKPLDRWRQANNLSVPGQRSLYLQEGHYTRNAGGSTQIHTCIDHSMHTPAPEGISVREVGTNNSTHLHKYSDHRPIWMRVNIDLNVPIVPQRRPLPVPLRVDLDLQDSKMVQRFQDNTHAAIMKLIPKAARRLKRSGLPDITSEHSGRILACSMRASVEVAETLTNAAMKRRKRRVRAKTRSKVKHGFSLAYKLLTAHMSFYNNLIRLAFPAGRHRHKSKWTEHSYQSYLSRLLRQWRKHNLGLLNSTATEDIQAKHLSPTHLQFMNFHQISLPYLTKQLKQLKGDAHGRNRTEMIEKQDDGTRKRQQLWQENRLGTLIRLMTGAPASTLDLQTLPCPTRGQIVDHFEIQVALNEFFHDWHAIPQNLDPAARRLATNNIWWLSLLHQTEQDLVKPLHEDSKIPLALQQGIRKVCQKKVTPRVEKLLQEAIDRPITFDQFEATINALPSGGAPGPSQVTVNMVKAWAPATKRFIYTHMLNLWTTRSTPTWFKDKLLKLAPKVAGRTELTNMRPISLYEIIRKIWTTMVAKRINLVWHQEKTLHRAQYGYQLDNGVHMALINTLSQIEGANIDKETKYLTFWDIRRAFDSIPRTLQKLAWRRLGVPRDVTDWFVDLDDGGYTFIATPYLDQAQNLHSAKDMLALDQHMSSKPELAFKAERGIGQGESASSLMWTAMYDMLLEWIDPRNRHLHTAEGDLDYSDEDAEQAKLNAYADDLGTATAGPRAEYMQQLQAKWVSAFCTFTGLVMNPSKIQPTTIGPRPPTPSRGLKVVQHDGTSITIPYDHDLLTYKYLGVELDLRHRPEQRLAAHRAATALKLDHLIQQPGSPEVKIDYIRFKILPIALYTALCANWTLKEYRELDKDFSVAYRKILCLPSTSPTALLYLPTSKGGVGLPRLSDRSQVMKWEAMLRCMAVGRDPLTSVNTILDRVPGPVHPPDTPLRFIEPPVKWPSSKKHIFARSLVEWSKESGLQLASRVYETPEEERAQIRNNTSLQELAEHLHLWPSEIYAEDDELRPVQFFATDGSYAVQPESTKDIITAEIHLRDRGKGAGGIVFMPPNPNDEVHSVRITSDSPEPGMNAFTWELASQLIALHIMKCHPEAVGYSDCTSALARTATALSSTYDNLGHTRAGIWASGVHSLSNVAQHRMFHHIKAHPERDPQRTAHPTRQDLAIFMADAAAGNTYKRLGGRELPMIRHELKLDNILNELIPLNRWHFRSANTHHTPILNDIIDHQHQILLDNMLRKRDGNNEEQRWTSTAIEFACNIHPPKNKSFWAAARRSLIMFDWIGHGRNLAKMIPRHTTRHDQVAACPHCKLPDNQAHCMLDCPYQTFIPIRKQARAEQARIAYGLIQKYTDPLLTHFMQTFCHASWTSTPQTTRLWLGTWQVHTLQSLLQQDVELPITNHSRYTYIKVAKALTAPLLYAYHQMIHVNTHHNPRYNRSDLEPLPLFEQHIQHQHTLTAPRDVMATTFEQSAIQAIIPSDSNAQEAIYIHNNTFAISDAAFSLEEADGTP